MTPTSTGHHGPTPYAIRVQGRLGSGWSAWFDGLEVTSSDDGTTTIHGPVADQAALHGVLEKLRDLGLPVLAVHQVLTDDTLTDDTSPAPRSPQPHA
jgi:hypothetical protein